MSTSIQPWRSIHNPPQTELGHPSFLRLSISFITPLDPPATYIHSDQRCKSNSCCFCTIKQIHAFNHSSGTISRWASWSLLEWNLSGDSASRSLGTWASNWLYILACFGIHLKLRCITNCSSLRVSRSWLAIFLTKLNATASTWLWMHFHSADPALKQPQCYLNYTTDHVYWSDSWVVFWLLRYVWGGRKDEDLVWLKDLCRIK
jgi:hypothetical protein